MFHILLVYYMSASCSNKLYKAARAIGLLYVWACSVVWTLHTTRRRTPLFAFGHSFERGSGFDMIVVVATAIGLATERCGSMGDPSTNVCKVNCAIYYVYVVITYNMYILVSSDCSWGALFGLRLGPYIARSVLITQCTFHWVACKRKTIADWFVAFVLR